jgi:Lactonase, 7-bladed beta-propeller
VSPVAATGLASQGALQITPDGQFLIAADAGSNQVSVLRIRPGGGLRLVPGGVVSSGGILPVSIAIHGDLVYVANAGGGGANYTGFRLGGAGRLRPIPGSTVTLPGGSPPRRHTVQRHRQQARRDPPRHLAYRQLHRKQHRAADARPPLAVHGGSLTELASSPFSLPAGAAPAGIVVT